MNISSIKAGLIFILVPLAILLGLRLFGFDGMAGQDSYAYVDYAIEIKKWLIMGIPPGHFAWPPGYSLLGVCFSLGLFSIALTMQLISCLSLSLILITLRVLLRNLYPSADQVSLVVYLVVFGMFAPYFFRQGMVTTSDMVAGLMVTLSIYFGYKFTLKNEFKDLIYTAVAVSFGTFTRYPTILVLTPWILYLVFLWYTTVRKIWHLIILCIPFCFIYGYSLFNTDIALFLHHPSVIHWEWSNYWKTTFISEEGTVHHLLPNMLFVFSPLAHPGYMLPGVLFIYLFFKENRAKGYQWIYWTLGYLSFVFFLAGYMNQNYRHLIIIYPIVLLACFCGFEKMFQRLLEYYTWKYILTGCMIVQCILCFRAIYPTLKRNSLERNIAHEILQYRDTINPVLYAFDIDIALKSRGIPYTIMSLYNRSYSTFQPGAMVLFNEPKLKTQWSGMNPMNNWNRLKSQYRLIKIKDFPDQWTLFKISQ